MRRLRVVLVGLKNACARVKAAAVEQSRVGAVVVYMGWGRGRRLRSGGKLHVKNSAEQGQGRHNVRKLAKGRSSKRSGPAAVSGPSCSSPKKGAYQACR